MPRIQAYLKNEKFDFFEISVGFRFGLPLKIFKGLVLEGKGFINLDHGLLILLLYPKVRVSSSDNSKPKLNVGNKPVSFLLVKSSVVNWLMSLMVFSTLNPNKKEYLSSTFTPYWVYKALICSLY